MRRKKFLMVLTILLTVVFFNAAAFAGEINEKQGQYDKTQEKIEDLKGKQKDIKEDIEDGREKISALDKNINGVSLQISDMEKKIRDAQGRIDVTTKDLNAAVEEYNNQDERMKNRINALYKNGTSMGYIQIILEADSFSDFISRTDILKKLLDYDINMLKEMNAKRKDINKKKAELEQDKAELVAVKSNLDNKKKELDGQKKERLTMVALLSRNLSAVNSAIQQEELAAKKLLEDIARLSSKGVYDGSKYSILRRSDFPAGRSPRITSDYGSRVDPITGYKSAYHSGIDIGTALLKNIPVYSMAPGRVVIARWYGGYGYAVVIDHGSGLSTLYGHNNKLLVSEGQTIAGGQKIALSGSTGRSTGPHVHFSVLKGGDYIDPSPYLYISN